MNCEWVKANITLYSYDELTDDARIELEQHVQRCDDCATELKSVQEFRGQMSAMPRLEPSPKLSGRVADAFAGGPGDHGAGAWMAAVVF